MTVQIDKSFAKDINKITDRKLLNDVAACIETIQNVRSISDISNCKKLRGSLNAYRIRIGNYRIGFVVEDNKIDFVRILHRKDIYKFFP